MSNENSIMVEDVIQPICLFILGESLKSRYILTFCISTSSCKTSMKNKVLKFKVDESIYIYF